MDLEQSDPTFWVYLTILLTFSILTFIMGITACNIIAEIKKMKEEAICPEVEEGPPPPEQPEEEEEAAEVYDYYPYYMAKIKHDRSHILQAKYQKTVNKYLKQQKAQT